MSIVHFPRGKRLHIDVDKGLTLCGKIVTKDAIRLKEMPKDGWFCPNCTQEVGYVMLPEYLGGDATTGKTLKQLITEQLEGKTDA